MPIQRRARPEPDRFRLRIPYADGRAIAAARAAFRVIGEQDAGDSLAMEVAGERRALSRFKPYLQ